MSWKVALCLHASATRISAGRPSIDRRVRAGGLLRPAPPRVRVIRDGAPVLEELS